MKNPSHWKKNAVGLPEKKEWIFCKKRKIEIYRTHRILIRQRNFESLADVKENMKHEKAYNEIARERYHNVMYFYGNRDV